MTSVEEPIFKEPEFISYRLNLWETLKKAKLEAASKNPIEVTLPDGKTVAGESGVTTPMDIALGISKGLARKVIVAKVDEALWDLNRPLVSSCELKLFTFEDEEGKETFWHSSAHVLGEALEYRYNAKLCHGPPLENGGFFYDVAMDEVKVSGDDYEGLNKFVQTIMKEQQPFERLVLTKEEALELFKYNPYKVEFITDLIKEDEETTAYRCGPLIDLCRGPHIPHTGFIKAFQVTNNSGAYWKADAKNDLLQRVYGISFPDKKLMKEYNTLRELAAKRDHRKIGEDQSLWFFDRLSPGCCFFLPHGARIYNKLIDMIKEQYRIRGYDEVVTPNVFNLDLWKTSGHLDNYKENMFVFESEKTEFGLKPMNCPGHCVMFKHKVRSYKELPIRFADFGVLHRNELSGALTGLTRVRRFVQDDAHIFCAFEDIFKEVLGVLDFLEHVYGFFGFKFSLALSTRPAKALGEIDLWNQAEKALEEVLVHFGKPWTINPGDGAFYGPKIDIEVTDALQRKHQCATIQLDFQLPLRFGLSYKSGDDNKEERPVMIHRAILGSVERFIAVLTEHIGGKWPFWLSPRQAIVIPVSLNFSEYAEEVRREISSAGYYVDVENSKLTLNKKIRNGQLAQYNFILVVGEEEMLTKTVNVRTRNNERHGTNTIPEILEKFAKLCRDHTMDSDLELLE